MAGVTLVSQRAVGAACSGSGRSVASRGLVAAAAPPPLLLRRPRGVTPVAPNAGRSRTGAGNGQPSTTFLRAATADPPTPSSSSSSTWRVKYLYDGDCPMCRTLKNVLTRQDGGAGRVAFVNIADSRYDEAANAGITYEEAMETIHVIKSDGDVVTGPDALRLLYDTVGLGWASRVAGLPVVSWVVDRLYDLISKYRLGIGGVDAVIAMKRLTQAEAGEDQCEKHGDTGCDAPEW